MAWVSLVLGVLSGLIFGSLVSYINYRMTQKFAEKANTESFKRVFAEVYIFRQIMNVAALLIIFLCRHLLPIPFYYPLIGTALGLSLPSQILAIRNTKKKKTDKS